MPEKRVPREEHEISYENYIVGFRRWADSQGGDWVHNQDDHSVNFKKEGSTIVERIACDEYLIRQAVQFSGKNAKWLGFEFRDENG